MAEKSFEVKQESLSQFQNFISEWCEENDIEMKISTKLLVCTDEIASNIVFYSEATELKIIAEKKDEMVYISFIDNGKPFNLLSDAKDPDITASAKDRQIGGLGIFIVKKMMKVVEYNRTDNTNCLKIGIAYAI